LARNLASEYSLKVEDANAIFQKYLNRKAEILKELNEESIQQHDTMVFDEQTNLRITCNGITLTKEVCQGKTLRACDENVYNCSLKQASNTNKMRADDQAQEEYKQELIRTICDS
jgi:hypothetical protein